jgi:ketosteroid isomerase-like protein
MQQWLVARWRAFNRGDLEAFAATIDDGVVWHAPGNNRFSGTSEGKAATLGRFQELGAAGVRFDFTDVHDVVGGDDHVVALLTVKATGPGGEVEYPAVFVMHVADGKLTEFWAMNQDQAEIDRIIG